jgi:hypothetical protein
MNWEAIGAIGEIGGALGVIITLVYLSVQLRQNAKASRLAAIQAASENSSRFSEMLASDNELVWRGLREPDSMDADEKLRFAIALNVFMRREAVAFYLHKEGVMPDSLWDARVGAMTGILNQPGMNLFLDVAGSTLPKDFTDFIINVTSRPSTLDEKTRKVLGLADDERHET